MTITRQTGLKQADETSPAYPLQGREEQCQPLLTCYASIWNERNSFTKKTWQLRKKSQFSRHVSPLFTSKETQQIEISWNQYQNYLEITFQSLHIFSQNLLYNFYYFQELHSLCLDIAVSSYIRANQVLISLVIMRATGLARIVRPEEETHFSNTSISSY